MMNYRKIWESHYGPIPFDNNGRRMEIHHKDGNRKNNSIDNLELLTIQEHYNIHYFQKDWAACQSIISRMKLSPDETRKIQSELALKRIKDGTHHFINPDYIKKDSERKRKRVGSLNNMWGKNHKLTTKELMSRSHKQLVDLGIHHTLSPKFSKLVSNHQKNLVKTNKHNFQKENVRENQKKSIQKMLDDGIHPLQNSNRIDPNKILVSCIICHKETTLPALSSHHKHDGIKKENPNSFRVCCLICKKETSKGTFSKWHKHDE